ncbi:hypothetical protein B7P43_G07456 [Cryptotermes secundus]|uniref:Uncharacterized protein n=1 Tax=Cryptotermes secundus TaxID=105785 RepID=A0A2J7RDM9_9NEOP|nr:hypothetical protein B7P43_G07456 [Cryptotermes secundus]
MDKERYNCFKDGRTSVDSEPRSRRPSTSRNENVIEQVQTLVMEGRRITVRELANEIGVSTGSVHSSLTEDLGMRRVSAKFVPTFVTKHNIPVVHQASYSPDMAPCDFWLFPKLKMPLKGTRFESREDIMRNAMAWLITIPKDVIQKCFQQWQKRWEKRVHYQETTLKGIRVLYLQITKCISADQRFDTF